MALGDPPPPIPAPGRLKGVKHPCQGEKLAGLGLLPRQPDWAAAFPEYWTPGEDAAAARLHDFVDATAEGYDRARDFPGEDGTSRLSPHLHWGEISPRRAARGGRHRRHDGPADLPQGADLARIRPPCAVAQPGPARAAAARRIREIPLPAGPGAAARGSGARRATPSSMPACASSGGMAGCTTGCG
ncbi:hypothetical protein [Teichococcus aestuarii]|uniref:hypothetical protein n=1 Tax=Teichococcus aestuarii TaxID=568898 RepID=UPI00361ED131